MPFKTKIFSPDFFDYLGGIQVDFASMEIFLNELYTQKPVYYEVWAVEQAGKPSDLDSFRASESYADLCKQFHIIKGQLIFWGTQHAIDRVYLKQCEEHFEGKIANPSGLDNLSAHQVYTHGKKVLEYLCYFIKNHPEKIESKKMKAVFTEDHFLFCTLGLLSLFQSIVNIAIIGNPLFMLLSDTKLEVAQQVAIELIRQQSQYLQIPIGNEIHYVNTLTNLVSTELGLLPSVDAYGSLQVESWVAASFYDNLRSAFDKVQTVIGLIVNEFFQRLQENLSNYQEILEYLNSIEDDKTFDLNNVIDFDQENNQLRLQPFAQQAIQLTVVKRLVDSTFMNNYDAYEFEDGAYKGVYYCGEFVDLSYISCQSDSGVEFHWLFDFLRKCASPIGLLEHLFLHSVPFKLVRTLVEQPTCRTLMLTLLNRELLTTDLFGRMYETYQEGVTALVCEWMSSLTEEQYEHKYQFLKFVLNAKSETLLSKLIQDSFFCDTEKFFLYVQADSIPDEHFIWAASYALSVQEIALTDIFLKLLEDRKYDFSKPENTHQALLAHLSRKKQATSLGMSLFLLGSRRSDGQSKDDESSSLRKGNSP